MSGSNAPPPGIRGAFSPELEGLRAVAFLFVFQFHAGGLLGFGAIGTPVGPAAALVAGGHTGVTLFFVLSAFLLARPFLERHRHGAAPAPARFWKRRVLRIMPLYTLAVGIGAVASAQTWRDVVVAAPYLLFLNSVPGLTEALAPWSAVWWSLATEVQFYLLLPLAFLLLHSRPGRAAFLLLAIGAAALYVALVSGDLSGWTIPQQRKLALSVVGRAPAFLVGIALAWVDVRFGPKLTVEAQRKVWLRAGAADGLWVAALVGLGLLLVPVVEQGFFRADLRWPVWHAYESLLWGMVLAALRWLPCRARALVSTRPFLAVGVLSYSAYLWHYPVLHFVLPALAETHPEAMDGWTPASGAVVLFCLALVLAVSAVTYRVVERPFLVRKARIG